MEASISLIIPVYNVDKYLAECLDNVIGQTVPFDEVIIINDGSTDHSLEICQRYASKDGQIKLISQENKGQSAARNRGLEKAQSEYIVFLDADDCLRADAVEILKEKLHGARYDAVFYDADIFGNPALLGDRKNIYDRSQAGLDEIVMDGREYFDRCYPENYVVSPCMGVYRARLLREKCISFPEGLYYEDNYFSFVFLEHAEKVIHISEKLYHRRYRPGSTTQSEYSGKKLSDHIQIGLLIWEEMGKRSGTLPSRQREVFLRHAGDYFCMVLGRYQYCKASGIPLGGHVEEELTSMAKQYHLLLESLNAKEKAENPAVFGRVLAAIYDAGLCQEENSDEGKTLAQDLAEIQKRIYRSLLKDIPLNRKGFKVGVYGTGKHTEGLLALYEELVGEIACDLYFIDSYKSQGTFWGRSLVNYKGIDPSTDLVILSSFLYEQEMLENVRCVTSGIPICRFYDNDFMEDIFSQCEAALRHWEG